MQLKTYLKAMLSMAAFAVVGCKSGTTAVTNIPGHQLAGNGGTGNTGNPGNGNTGNTGLGNGGTGSGNNGPNINNGGNTGWPEGGGGFANEHEVLRGAFQKVHFAYDSAEVRPEDVAHIARVADHMIQNPTHLLEIEGHCDERGTEDYNLALGERRALAIIEVLAQQGVDLGRLATKSMGEKMPVVEGGNKESHAANRRGEFVLYVPMAAATGATPQRVNLVPGGTAP